MKKGLTNSMYWGYDLLSFGKVNYYYHQVKTQNKILGVFNNSAFENYLVKWGLSKNLEKNPLLIKNQIKIMAEKLPANKIYNWAYTGGSTGEPLRIPYSKKRTFIRTATFRYFNELGGYSLGDSFALIRAKDKSPLIKFLRNETIIVPHDTSAEKLGTLISELKRKKVKVLMGYPSVIYEMALFMLQHPEMKKELPVKNIISVSEPLEQHKRQIIKDVFNCPFIDRYSNEEVGMIAQQKAFGGEYFVNMFGLIVEVVDPKTLLPVKEGKQGKVLVTDYLNELIPMVRYDTGDLAVAHKYENNRLTAITNIVGRVTEQIFTPEGTPVSPLALGPFIYKPLSKEGILFPYQFAQTGSNNYELRIKASKDCFSDTLHQTIHSGLHKTLGPKAIVTIKLVDDIKPQLSGKRPVFKNEFMKSP